MSFKHNNLTSPVLHSLAVSARANGQLPIKQAAAPKPLDLTPSSILMDNIVRLAQGLRTKGLHTEAQEIEHNFLAYKRANSLYDVSGETGEDLIHAAHPKGSHKLEGVVGDEATFEDILDRHAKMLQMVEKKPTGKHSSAAHILQQVKKALAQAAAAKDPTAIIQSANNDMDKVYAMAVRSGGLSNTVLNWLEGRIALVKKLSGVSANDLSLDDINKAMDAIDAIRRNLHPNMLHNYLPEFLNKGVSSDILCKTIEPILVNARQKLEDAASLAANIQANSTSVPVAKTPELPTKSVADPTASFIASLANSIAEFQRVKGFVASEDPKDAQSVAQTQGWLDKRMKGLQALQVKFEAEPNKAQALPDYQSMLTKYTAGLSDIKKDWLS